jgi:hypothetical protein
MRWLLVGAVALVVVAGIPLFFLSASTEQFFAWTIQPPLSAAFLGAGYWSVAWAVVLALREREWTRIRVIVPAVTLGVSLILLATLLHLDRFHFTSSIITAQIWAWAWLVLYAVLVLALLVALWQQRQVTGVELPRQRELAPWLRYAMAGLGLVMLLIGVGLIVAPTSVGQFWPWQLTPLTGRMAGAWFTAIGLAIVTAARENDYARIYVAAATGIIYAGLQLVNIARYPDTIQWARPSAWGYIAILVVLAVVSAASLQGYFALRPSQARLAGR